MKKFVRKLMFCFLISIIYFAVGMIIAFIILKNTNYNFADIVVVEGVLVFIVGILMSLSGNPSGMSINSIGDSNVQQSDYANNMATVMDRSARPYHKGFTKNNVVEFGVSNITFIMSGVLLVLVSLLLYDLL